ncbi:MAG: anhydro-N-acetylmuramic acid kinase [Pontibacterium sp.]
MNNRPKNGCYIGLMSGTSLDGLDIAAACFEPSFQLLAAETVPLPTKLRQSLLDLCQPGSDEINRMALADIEFGRFCGEQVKAFVARHSLRNICAVGSHGQTIRHLPHIGHTLQIGDPNLIAEITGLTVVADFRRRDMAAGGQGAPLVPAFHKALFGQDGTAKMLANIGGIANITFIPSEPSEPISGYDTGPGNTLLDSWIQTTLGKNFDEDGKWAASGLVDQTLLEHLLSEQYFSKPAPKSTGRETFHLDWLASYIRQLPYQPKDEDIQATLLELTAQTLSTSINQSSTAGSPVYLCGGGARNNTLVTRLQALTSSAVLSTEALGLEPDYVEAAAFAWLAYCAIEEVSANAPEVTGASGLRKLGAIYPA